MHWELERRKRCQNHYYKINIDRMLLPSSRVVTLNSCVKGPCPTEVDAAISMPYVVYIISPVSSSVGSLVL